MHRLARARGRRKKLTDGERFAYRLSLALGLPTLDWLDGISAGELAGWWAYYNAEPWGGERDDLRAEVTRLRSSGCELENIKAMYPYWEEPESVDSQKAKLERLAAEMRKQRGLA